MLDVLKAKSLCKLNKELGMYHSYDNIDSAQVLVDFNRHTDVIADVTVVLQGVNTPYIENRVADCKLVVVVKNNTDRCASYIRGLRADITKDVRIQCINIPKAMVETHIVETSNVRESVSTLHIDKINVYVVSYLERI